MKNILKMLNELKAVVKKFWEYNIIQLVRIVFLAYPEKIMNPTKNQSKIVIGDNFSHTLPNTNSRARRTSRNRGSLLLVRIPIFGLEKVLKLVIEF